MPLDPPDADIVLPPLTVGARNRKDHGLANMAMLRRRVRDVVTRATRHA